MKLAVMQPYFFPYIGYFQLMNWADRWVVFDEVQFIDKGWINRNRVLHPDLEKQWQFVTVPLRKHGRYEKISDIVINTDQNWKSSVLGKLTAYKKKAPYYSATIEFVETCLEGEQDGLSDFLVNTLRLTAEHLHITTKIDVQSAMDLHLGDISHPGQWALRISQALGASVYCNPHGGAEIFDDCEFEQSQIQLKFLRPNLEPYVQRRGGFVPGLSVIDVLMWNDPEEIAENMLHNYELLDRHELLG